MDVPTEEPRLFDMPAVERHVDVDSLNETMRRIYEVISDGQWRSLANIADHARVEVGTCGARLRDFRKMGHHIDRENRPKPQPPVYRFRP